MALSNSQYDAIMRAYGRQQIEDHHQLEERRQEIYRKLPVVKELEAEIARLKEENSKLQETVQWMHDLIWKMVRDREGQKGDPADGTYACSDVREDQDQKL